MLRLESRKGVRHITPNVKLLDVCRDRAYEAFVRKRMAAEVESVMGEPIPNDEQLTAVDVYRTQILPFSDLYPQEEE